MKKILNMHNWLTITLALLSCSNSWTSGEMNTSRLSTVAVRRGRKYRSTMSKPSSLYTRDRKRRLSDDQNKNLLFSSRSSGSTVDNLRSNQGRRRIGKIHKQKHHSKKEADTATIEANNTKYEDIENKEAENDEQIARSHDFRPTNSSSGDSDENNSGNFTVADGNESKNIDSLPNSDDSKNNGQDQSKEKTSKEVESNKNNDLSTENGEESDIDATEDSESIQNNQDDSQEDQKNTDDKEVKSKNETKVDSIIDSNGMLENEDDGVSQVFAGTTEQIDEPIDVYDKVTNDQNQKSENGIITSRWFNLSHYVPPDSIVYDIIQGFLIATLFCLIMATCYNSCYYCLFVRCGLCPDDRIQTSLLYKKRKKRRKGIPNRFKNAVGNGWFSGWFNRNGAGGHDGRGLFVPLSTMNPEDFSDDDSVGGYKPVKGIEAGGSSGSDVSVLSLEYGDENMHDEYGEVSDRLHGDKVEIAAKEFFTREERASRAALKAGKNSKRKRSRSRGSRRSASTGGKSKGSLGSWGGRSSRISHDSSILSSSSEEDDRSIMSSSTEGDHGLEMEVAMMDLELVERKMAHQMGV